MHQNLPFDPIFQVEGLPPTNNFSSQKTRLNDLLYRIKIWTDFSSVLSQCTPQTDGQIDRQTDRQIVGRTDRILIATRVCIPCIAVIKQN